MGYFWSTGQYKGSSTLMWPHQRLSFLRLWPSAVSAVQALLLFFPVNRVLLVRFGKNIREKTKFFPACNNNGDVICGIWWWCPPPNDMKLHSDLVLVNSLRRDLMCCSAATQADCPQPEIPPALTGAFSVLPFSNHCLCACVCMRARCVVLYLWESDCPQRVEPSLWLNNALCICGQVIYMRCDRMPPSRPPRPPPASPASAHFPWALCTTRPPHLMPESGSLPSKFSRCWVGCCRSVCRWLKHQKMFMLEGI